ncbi:hypothetical protein JYU34_019742, partial [Plutella xylostella]
IPYLELAEPDEGYHGLIRENETLVEVTPAIRARGPLCSFLILNNKHHGEAPFEVSLSRLLYAKMTAGIEETLTHTLPPPHRAEISCKM